MSEQPTLRVTGYGGTRQSRSSTSRFTGVGATSSGGVVEPRPRLRRCRRALHRARRLGGRAVGLLGGRRRRPHARDSGRASSTTSASRARCAATRTTRCAAATCYAEAQWHALPALSLTLGVRTSRGPIRVGRPLRQRGRIPTTAAQRTLHATRARSPASVWHARERPQRVRELRPGLRDARRSPSSRTARSGPASISRSIPRPSTSVGAGLKWLPSPRQRVNARGIRRATPSRRSSSTPRPAAARRTATRARRAAAGSRPCGTRDLGGGFAVHANYSYSRRNSSTVSSPGSADRSARRRAPARRAAATGVWRRALDAGALLRIQRGAPKCNTSAACT